MKALGKFIRSEAVLVISAIAAAISACFVAPNATYLGYIDFRVLTLLFCLMAVIAGIMQQGVFEIMGQRLICKANNLRLLSIILVMLCFFSSMLITNDVSLLTFVPFAITVLRMAQAEKLIMPIVILQTLAANLGSMLTPVGNPQNLYLYSYYSFDSEQFFAVTAPITAISFLLIFAICLLLPKTPIQIKFTSNSIVQNKKMLICLLLLFLICLLTVFNIIPYPVTLIITITVLLLTNRQLYGEINYGLLATFICFFIFIGNISHMDIVRENISALILGHELLASTVLSQFISNVPAAIMLSGFTTNSNDLIVGANIGGLGTLIASLASLISFRIYCNDTSSHPLRYLSIFTVANLFMLAVLLLFWASWSRFI